MARGIGKKIATKMVEGLSALTTSHEEVTPDILLMNFTIVNAFLVGDPNHDMGDFVLVDTGLANSKDTILECIEERFGADRRPHAIILTHGHFDHIGSVIALSEKWQVPVYIHHLEMPYVTGQKDYPVADSSVDPGMVAKMSPLFPNEAIDISPYVSPLPVDGTVPGLPEWTWIHTPGHTEGHVALWREGDRTLIVGDAFTTVKQESLSSVVSQETEISGPPKYLTTDWTQAEQSVRHLRELQPRLVIPSHGKPLSGDELTGALDRLVRGFEEIAKPDQGRFVDDSQS